MEPTIGRHLFARLWIFLEVASNCLDYKITTVARTPHSSGTNRSHQTSYQTPSPFDKKKYLSSSNLKLYVPSSELLVESDKAMVMNLKSFGVDGVGYDDYDETETEPPT